MVSIMIRQVDENNNKHINDKAGEYMFLPFDNTSSVNSKCGILRPDYVNGSNLD